MRIRVSKEKEGQRKIIIVPSRRSRLGAQTLIYEGRKGYGGRLEEAVGVVSRAEMVQGALPQL